MFSARQCFFLHASFTTFSTKVFIPSISSIFRRVYMSNGYIFKEILNEVKGLKKMLLNVEDMLEVEKLTKQDIKAILASESEFKKGKFVTLEQLKSQLGI
jgi:hypothetical protein